MPIIIVIFFGPRLFGLIFGSEWFQSGAYARFLGLSLLLEFIVSPLSQTMNILERQDLQLVWDISYFIMVIGTLLFSYWIGFEVNLAVILYAGSLFLSYSVQMIILWKLLQRFAESKTL
jgi:O-antigen/teichoic acid export membrane protein